MESSKKNPQRVRTRYTKEFKLEAVRKVRGQVLQSHSEGPSPAFR